MLNPEQARERLKEFKLADNSLRRRKAAAMLPPRAREAAYCLLHCDADGKALADRDAVRRRLAEIPAKLDALRSGERRQLFEAMLPGLAEHAERAWQTFQHLPYQTYGHNAKAFRAPRNPEIIRPARAQWVVSLLAVTAEYQQDVAWYAAWAPHLGYNAGDTLGFLFAAAIDAAGPEGDQVFDILCASARGEHASGMMGRHVTRGLLVASRPDGWTFVEQLLLAAQRQEGLRQVILESIDLAQPDAFRRMLRLIVAHDLARFSATLRALDVWLGFGWDVTTIKPKQVNALLERLLVLLEQPKECKKALSGTNAEDVYLGLWTMAYADAPAAIKPAAKMLRDKAVEKRFVGARLLMQLGLTAAQKAVVPALADDDLRVVAQALGAFVWPAPEVDKVQLFEQLERLLARMKSDSLSLTPIVWPWLAPVLNRRAIGSLFVRSLGKRSPKRLIPSIPMLDPWARASVVTLLAAGEQWDGEVRQTIFKLAGDSSASVREHALAMIGAHPLEPKQVPQLEHLLTRKAADLRRGVLTLLLKQNDAGALASAARLLASSGAESKQAGLELLEQLSAAGRSPVVCRATADLYRSRRKNLSDGESAMLDRISGAQRTNATLDDALGLSDGTRRTPVVSPPVPARRDWITPAALACLKSLDELIQANCAVPVVLERRNGKSDEILLGNLTHGFPPPNPAIPLAEDLPRFVLHETWDTWCRERPDALRDADGLELLRALAAFSHTAGRMGFFNRQQRPAWLESALQAIYPGADSVKLQYPSIVHGILLWLLRMSPQPAAVDLLLDAVAFTLAQVPPDELRRLPDPKKHFDQGWRSQYDLMGWLNLTRTHAQLYPATWEPAHHVRFWQLLHWIDEPLPGISRHRPLLSEVLAAYGAGGATDADIFDQLLGPRAQSHYMAFHSFGDLYQLSGRKGHRLFEVYPDLRNIVQVCRERILAVELERGDLPTAASVPALSLRWSGGLDSLVRIMRGLGNSGFARGWLRDSRNKPSVLSHMARVTFPAESDSPEMVASVMGGAPSSQTINTTAPGTRAFSAITEERLIELALYAPQWSAHVEHALGWAGLASAVWWLHAHTKDKQWSVDADVRDAWAAQVGERTPLSAQELLDGAVDVAWFRRAYEMLGPERWNQLYEAAKYTSGGQGHNRAKLFASAMLGQVSQAELVQRMTRSRQQDAVRALGLLPLPDGSQRAASRRAHGSAEGKEPFAAECLHRYQAVKEFVRSGRKFGSMRQANEKLAASMALANLARTAGYPDPVRLEWAMEAESVADLAQGALTAVQDDVVMRLGIESGEPVLSVSRAGTQLKSLPARYKKVEAFVELQARKRELERQTSRMRLSLEEAMCRGDSFSGADLRQLMAHPLLAPLLSQLVFVGGTAAGYPVACGAMLRAHDEQSRAVDPAAQFRLAHSCDLFARKDWSAWQRECFMDERIQPFKQIFRELYVLTGTEQDDGARSRRYAGQQVNPKQAMALLGQRGWISHIEEGVRRTFHAENITAWLTFSSGVMTPAEVEGLTLDTVMFTRRGEWQALPLASVPLRIFSEVMRDLDLVVSVAHVGGVDPEASASTVEMRAALVAETVQMLSLSNVKVQGRHTLVQGQLGSYSIHLGSAVVHRQPGGSLCIVPVHSQQRGRLFLPFTDNDPKSAEVLAKILLLAKDHEIKDPVILEQIDSMSA
jgi:hypothetical protein